MGLQGEFAQRVAMRVWDLERPQQVEIMMNGTILVTGGTGLLGRRVIAELERTGSGGP